VDPIIKELASSLDGEKVGREAKTQVSEVLAYVARDKGKSVTKIVADGVLTILDQILENNLYSDNFNDKTKCNVAAAYAFFGAHHMKQNEWDALYDKYDEDSFSMGASVKMAMLLSAKGLPSKLEDMKSCLVNALSKNFFKDVVEKGPSGEAEEAA
jgi:hypothetical protein